MDPDGLPSRHRVRSNCSTGVESCAEAVATAAGGAAMFPRPVYPGSGVTLLASLSPAVAASLIGEMDPKKAKVIVEEMWRMREVAGG